MMRITVTRYEPIPSDERYTVTEYTTFDHRVRTILPVLIAVKSIGSNGRENGGIRSGIVRLLGVSGRSGVNRVSTITGRSSA
jgi:hypothetical protein